MLLKSQPPLYHTVHQPLQNLLKKVFHRQQYKKLVEYCQSPHKYIFIQNDKYMLDIKSKLVLKLLSNLCPNGEYEIIESKEIISQLPSKYKVDESGLCHIIDYLEHLDCISIKYEENGLYCLSVLPFGYELIENEHTKGVKESNRPFWLVFLLVPLLAFIGGLLGTIIASFII